MDKHQIKNRVPFKKTLLVNYFLQSKEQKRL